MFRISMLRLLTFALAFCGLSALFAPQLLAQTGGTGALTVTVKDPTGAVVPGANVAVTNTSGVARSEVTSSDGSFTFTLLPPGSYHVTISAQGFKTAEAPSVEVDVSETHVLNQSLEVGAQQQEVTVNATAETVQTETSTLGGVVNTRAIADLPMPTRNYTSLLSLSPGVVVSATNASAYGRGDQFIFANGEDDSSNTYLLDGSQASSYASGTTGDYIGFYGSIAIPSPDALQEFKVQTSNFDAGYGRTTGASVNIVTKSGTNDWHGTLFEFFRNDDLNANTFFNNETGQPRGELKQNQYGGTLGGPIKKDKLFFFFSYQGTRQLNGVAYQGSAAVTLPPQLTNNRTAAGLGAAFCTVPTYTTGAANPASDQVACNGSNINPVALAYLNFKLPNGTYLVPTPQTIRSPGTASAVGFSTFSIPASFKEDQAILNMDYAISTKQTLSLKYYYAIAPSVTPFYGSGLLAQSAEPPGGGNTGESGNQNFSVKLTSILSNNLVNEIHFSDSYIRAELNTGFPVTAADVGMTPSSTFNPISPTITVNSVGLTFGGVSIDGVRAPSTTYEWQDQLSWNHGRQSIRIGYDASHVNWLACSCGKTRGGLTFQTFSDFLLGESAAQNGTALSNVFTSTANVQPFSNPNLVRQNDEALFVQDDIKVNQRLTLNVGLRWEYPGWAYDDNPSGGTDAVWSLLQTVPIPPTTGTFVGLTVANHFTGAVPAGVIRRNTNLLSWGHAPFDDFAPRIGFAWQPLNSSGRFVVRGGYGWFYQLVHGQQFLDTLDGEPPIAAPLSRSSAANAAATFAVPFNPPVALGTFNTFLRTPTSAISLVSMNPNLVTPLSFSWNLNLQYAFTPSWQLQVGYVGSRSEHIDTGQSFDVPQLASPTNPLNCGAPFGCVTTNTTGNASQRLPVLGFAPGGLRYGGNWGDSEYNALQVTVRKAFSHGLQMQAAYTYDRCISNLEGATFAGAGQGGDVNYDIGLQNLRAGRGECGFDRPQRLIVNYVYTLPSYHQAEGIAGKALSGWGATGVVTLQAGLPMAFTDSRGGAVYGAVGTAGANLCSGMTIGNILTSGSVLSRLNTYFNKSAFCAPPVVGQVNGVGGATGYGNLGNNILLGPNQFNWDLGIVKNTKVGGIREDGNIEFRAEMFNAFNHPQFSNPSLNVNAPSTFGVISSTSVGARVVQIALKYAF